MPGEWIPEKAVSLYSKFFPGDWREVSTHVLQGRCPGEHAHTGSSAPTDARIFLSYGPNGESPGCYCLHKSCRGHLATMNEDFRNALFAKDGSHAKGTTCDSGVVRRAPRPKEDWIPDYSEEKLRHVVRAVPPVTPDWFISRSPIDPTNLSPGEFIEAAFEPGDRVLIFTNFYSQGEYLWQVGRGGYRLGEQQGHKAVRSALPRDGGKDGVWFLSNPVDGVWHPNSRREGKLSRRSEESVTAWRHLVLESDDAPAELWLRFLAMCPVPIRAIYSSGGRSWHALIRVDQPDKPTFDAFLRDRVKRVFPLLGADPGAMTPVRLTRLPSCTRAGRIQRLIYLNPRATYSSARPIIDLPILRSPKTTIQ